MLSFSFSFTKELQLSLQFQALCVMSLVSSCFCKLSFFSDVWLISKLVLTWNIKHQSRLKVPHKSFIHNVIFWPHWLKPFSNHQFGPTFSFWTNQSVWGTSVKESLHLVMLQVCRGFFSSVRPVCMNSLYVKGKMVQIMLYALMSSTDLTFLTFDKTKTENYLSMKMN